jgi:hypothetical protein
MIAGSKTASFSSLVAAGTILPEVVIERAADLHRSQVGKTPLVQAVGEPIDQR